MAQPVPPASQLARVLTHPLRPRILEFLAARGEASPNEMAAEFGVPLGMLSYHTRLLRDLGWIELVRTVPRRGAIEHFYRASVRPFLDDAQWERLPEGVRRRLAALTVDQILQAAASAAGAGGFDRPEVHIDRVQLELDDQGWRELSEVLTGVLDEAARIQEASNARRSSRDAPRPERSELAILHFAGEWGGF
jgi:DNA-binding transcriptional ArsR family regulator